MKQIDAIVCGIASLFTCPNTISSNVFQKFPSSYEKSVEKSLQKGWMTVGKTIKGAIEKYGEENEKSSS